MIEICNLKVRTIAGGFGAPLQLVVTLWLCLRGVWTRRWVFIRKLKLIHQPGVFMRKIKSSNQQQTSVTCLAWSGPRAAMAIGLLPCQRSPPHPPLLPGGYLEYPDKLWSTSLLSSLVCNLRLSRLQNVRPKSWDELCWHWFRGLLQLPFLVATLLFRVSISLKEMGCPPPKFWLTKNRWEALPSCGRTYTTTPSFPSPSFFSPTWWSFIRNSTKAGVYSEKYELGYVQIFPGEKLGRSWRSYSILSSSVIQRRKLGDMLKYMRLP